MTTDIETLLERAADCQLPDTDYAAVARRGGRRRLQRRAILTAGVSVVLAVAGVPMVSVLLDAQPAPFVGDAGRSGELVDELVIEDVPASPLTAGTDVHLRTSESSILALADDDTGEQAALFTVADRAWVSVPPLPSGTPWHDAIVDLDGSTIAAVGDGQLFLFDEARSWTAVDGRDLRAAKEVMIEGGRIVIAVVEDGRLLIELLDRRTGTWTSAPANFDGSGEATLAVEGSRLVAVGGRADAAELALSTMTWTELPNLPTDLGAGREVLLVDGHAVVSAALGEEASDVAGDRPAWPQPPSADTVDPLTPEEDDCAAPVCQGTSSATATASATGDGPGISVGESAFRLDLDAVDQPAWEPIGIGDFVDGMDRELVNGSWYFRQHPSSVLTDPITEETTSMGGQDPNDPFPELVVDGRLVYLPKAWWPAGGPTSDTVDVIVWAQPNTEPDSVTARVTASLPARTGVAVAAVGPYIFAYGGVDADGQTHNDGWLLRVNQ